MKKPEDPKEKGLVKGALRRIFSRSELRKRVIERTRITHSDSTRARVTKWSFCEECGMIQPTYLMEVDHVCPIIRINEVLNDLSLDELADRIWCDENNLRVVDKDCHKSKTREENKLRRETKKGKKL